MASTSDKAACRTKMKLECVIHVSKTASGKVTAFTNISKAKVIRCANEWKALGGELGDFANTLLSDNADLNLTLDTTTCGYHRQCYMKFTDVSKISRAKSKLTQSVEDLPAQTDTADFRDFSHNDQSGKASRVPDGYSGSLQTAAQIRNDEKLLLYIRDQDLVALEAKYHKTCYQQYVRVLSTQKKQDGLLGIKQYQKAYEIFCHDIVEERIVKNAEIFRLTKLLQIFKGYVHKFENLDAAKYRTYSLQHRLKGSYPQLVFLRPSRKNLSCLVYSDNLTTADVVEDLPFDDDNSFESSTSDTDDIIPSVKNPSPTSIRDLYMSAQNLKSSVTQHHFEPMEWPPTAAALNLSNAEHVVPTKLYNFLAWVVGASEEPVITSKVKVEDSVHHKLLSVAQDVMQLAFKGKKMTPKYLSLGMAVRHLTGSAQLIGLLNGLSHCSSHSVVLEHDTALAQQHLDHTDALPATIVPGEFLTFVWDNIDFGEETLTGKGTTHSTNGLQSSEESMTSLKYKEFR
ncbi:hypothetical protein BSL78_16736 [Apostichopus japonicus]|uniref:Uncharacterized protein n=1 Tax=Stichopus japonicus TaxID=307972 RepID=A0A2G8KEI8_STIJA|nr:hypothetical protein BSL78_16736 [Apostichopus japonicus]